MNCLYTLLKISARVTEIVFQTKISVFLICQVSLFSFSFLLSVLNCCTCFYDSGACCQRKLFVCQFSILTSFQIVLRSLFVLSFQRRCLASALVLPVSLLCSRYFLMPSLFCYVLSSTVHDHIAGISTANLVNVFLTRPLSVSYSRMLYCHKPFEAFILIYLFQKKILFCSSPFCGRI